MGYKEEMIAYAGRLGVRGFGELSLPELAKRIESDPEQTTPRTKLYAYMTWLSDHLQEINNSDEDVFSREIATWCLFVNEIGFDRDNVVGAFEEWVHEHSEVERSSARRLSMAELEVKKFYCIPTEALQFVPADEYHQLSPPAEQTSQQFSPVNEASEAQHVGGFGHIHPDRLKLSKYVDSNPEKGEVIDLDQWQRSVVDISSDEEAIPRSKTDLSFLTGANRMVFSDDETNLNTDIKETKRSKKKSKTQVMQPGPTSGQTKKKNKNPCGRCGVPGHYHMQCPTNLDPSFDKSPPNDYRCNLCSKCGNHYATVCKRNMNPASLNQQRKRHTGQKYHPLPSRGRSRSPLREPKDKRHTRMERSPYRVSKDTHYHSRESSPYKVSETRYHVDRDRSRERNRRRRSRSRYRSPSPPRQALRRRDHHRNNKMYQTKHSSPEPKFEEQDSSSPPQFGALDYDIGFDHMPDQPYRPMISRPTDVKIRGRGSSFYYDTNGEGPMQPPAYGDGDLMSRKRRRSETPAPHQDDRVGRSTVDKGFFLTELTELIANTTVSPRPQALARNRLPEVFKNDLRQPSWSWDTAPTTNTTMIKPEPVPDIVREPSPPVELGVTEKRLDGRRATQYYPAILELFKNRKNVWIHKIDKAMRPQASSFFWDKELEENDMDASAHPDFAVEIESAKDTVMTEAEPVAPPIDEADTVDTAKIESEPVMTDNPQRADLTSTIDVVMENSVTMQIIHRDDDNPRTQQSGEDIRGDLKPADDIVMEDAKPLHIFEADVAPEEVDVSAIVDKIIADMRLPEAANTAPEPVEKGSPPVESATNSKTLLPAQKTSFVHETVNEASAAVSFPASAATSTGTLTSREIVLVQETVNEALAASADIVPEVELNHAPTADDNGNDTPREGTQDDGDNVSSDTVIKDVIYVKIAPEPKPTETATSQPEEQAAITVPEESQAQ